MCKYIYIYIYSYVYIYREREIDAFTQLATSELRQNQQFLVVTTINQPGVDVDISRPRPGRPGLHLPRVFAHGILLIGGFVAEELIRRLQLLPWDMDGLIRNKKGHGLYIGE